MIREFLAVAARAALEWALASLLLANGAAFCLIAAAAARLRLGPPCIACARVHRLLSCSSSAATGNERDALRRLLCDAHLAAVAVAPPDRCDGDGVSETEAAMAADDQDKVSGMETHRVVSIGSEICEQDQDGNKPDAGDRSSRTTSTDDGNGPLVSLFELAPIVSRPRPREDDDSIDQHQATMAESSLTVDGDGGESLTLGELVTAFRAQRRELQALRAELAAERRSRAEAEEYQRQLEEQGELDREAARLAMQLVYESETEKHGLQRQLEACRVRAQLYQSDPAATEDGVGGGGGGCREANGGGDGNGNNYQSLVDFLPGSVYSSSPDLANLLKLYTESGNAGRRRREDYDVPAIAVVEEAEEEEEVAVAVAVMAGTESSRTVDATSAIVSESLQESSNTFHVETVTEAA